MDRLIDSHCHLTDDELSSRIEDVLARAQATGVCEIVTIATDPADAARALTLAAARPDVYVVAGLHPHRAAAAAAGWDDALREIVSAPHVYAVGETGLDYYYDHSPREAQRAAFRRQLEIASAVRKPVVIHCREAHDDVLSVLADFPGLPGVVFHCFTGSPAEAEQILARGYWISLTGVVTFKRSDVLREVARMIPAERLMLETDAPYLSPEPVRARRPNEPSYLVHTAACVAAQRGQPVGELARLTVANTRRFFSLPHRPDDSR